MIETKQLTYQYDTGESPKTVLQDVNLVIDRGEFVAVLGHNGSGKSTLAKHFNAILLPNGGSVYVEKMDTRDEKKLYDIRQKVGMVFQNPDNQLVATVVEEDVAFAPENLGVPQREIRRRVDDSLKAVGMYDYRKKAPHLLSGGQKQRVAIAGIIAMEPDYIVLDEPTAMLDPSGREEVMKTILKLNRERGITIVLITHYMDEAVQANRVVVMDEGRVLLDGPPRTIFPQVEKLKGIGLDVPQATELMFALQKDGIATTADVLNTEECVEVLSRLFAPSLEGGRQQ